MKKLLSILNAVILIVICFPLTSAAECIGVTSVPPRQHILMDADWQFAFGDASDPAKDFGCGTEYFNYLTKANSVHNEGPYSAKFDASGWKRVDLPYDFVVELPYSSEGSHSHGYKQVGYKFPKTSVGWYRKTFTVDKADEGKHFVLTFDGIFRDSRIWVNGFYAGGDPSGYLSQSFDITEYLNYGGENLICVRSDATLEEGWFYEGGGIYRHVWLDVCNPIHIADNGITVRTTFTPGDESYSKAFVSVDVNIENTAFDNSQYRTDVTIFDAEGASVGDTISNPHLWSPDTPYLYNAVVDVYDKDGRLIDEKSQKFGIRDVVFDKDRGLILNGRQLKIKGVNLHQDHAGVGAGIPDALLVYRIKKLKEFGCNAYRSSHNPMSPAMLDVCDSLGMMVIDENRLSGVSEYEISQLKRMIDRDRNHPSIILWSCGNEEWGIEWDKKGEKIAKKMSDYCHLFDPTRLSTFATSGGPTVEVPVDVAGYNYVVQNPIEDLRRQYPERKCYGSEETTGCGTRGCYFDDRENGHMMAHNRQPNGKDSIMNCIERGWKFYAERPWAAGCFFWTGFDYRGEPNPLKFPATGSEFGILDYCGFPKDEAYYLKSWWTDEPVLHLLPHWNLAGHEGETIDVWAYSNCDEVELYVNGKSLGKQTMPRNGHLSWLATYKPGKLVAVGYRNGRKVLTEKVETTGEVTQVRVAKSEGLADDGVTIFDLDLLDKKGRVVPDACNDMLVVVPDGCEIIGWGNGDPAFQYVERPQDRSLFVMPIKAFNGHAQVIVKSSANIQPDLHVALNWDNLKNTGIQTSSGH